MASAANADEVAAAFYEALRQSDLAQLMACWADDAEILCVQPGGSRLVGPSAIRAAFESMFEAEGSLSVSPEYVRKCETAELSIHSILEKLAVLTDDGPQQVWVVATL
ncbi:MAG: nuclear transport factor 2 family protein, partial [Burkholderiaceae bacterium]|nr:nuclear transport factor 2 family protein [Burkholderiaceae bacterium]